MLSLCGFNAYGQLGADLGNEVHNFTDAYISEFGENKEVQIVSSAWSYTMFAVDDTLVMKGHLESTDRDTFTYRFGTPIKDLKSCDWACFVVLANRQIFSMKMARPLAPELVSFMSPIDEDDSFCITHLACGNNICVAISNENIVYDVATPIYTLPENVHPKELACGSEHALMLSHEGDIYCWGNGLRGQLGLDEIGHYPKPVLLEALAGIRIISIGAAGWHSVALSVFGDIYAWGSNSHGQLGLPLSKQPTVSKIVQDFHPLPTLPNIPDCLCGFDSETGDTKCHPIAIEVGVRHTICILSCGSILVAGDNQYGQLGKGKDVLNIDEFELCPYILDNGNVNCGGWCTFILGRTNQK